MRRCLLASLCALTSTLVAPHAANATADEARLAVTNDADLAPRLEHQHAQRTRLYRVVLRREWAGAAAGLIELRSQPDTEPVPSAGPTPPAASPRRAPLVAGGVWDRLAQCESGGDWSIATGNGFYGGLQFTLGTWRAYGGVGMPNQASREQQISVAERVLAGQGWVAWPACSRKLGLR